MIELSFRELIHRVRLGDERAVGDLVRAYEPAIRREARLRLTAPDMRRWMDSEDVCQSVLASFFVRAANGCYELDQPGQLIRLLARMARHKVVDRVCEQRSLARTHSGGAVRAIAPDKLEQLRDRGEVPLAQVSLQDALNAAQERLTPEERELSDLRARGITWPEIAEQLGTRAEGLRKRLNRAMDRVVANLGLDEV